MEKTFPGVKVFLSARDEYMYLLKNQERIISKTQLKENRQNFSYIRELFTDMTNHPIEAFMNESDIPCGPIFSEKSSNESQNCVLLTTCNPPVRELTGLQISNIIKFIKNCGCNPAINEKINNFDWVVSVENEFLYEAASSGKRTTLIPTGFGENLFRRMFPQAEIYYPV